MDVSTNPLALAAAVQDAPAFLSAARALFPLLALLWVAGLVRVRRPAWLLVGILAANGWAFAVTNLPLQRLYALGVGSDRTHNLGMCQVVAAGNSPLQTWQVGQSHFELQGRPHNLAWVLLVATLSGFDPDRVFLVYALLPLLAMGAVVLGFFFGLAPARARLGSSDGAASDWSSWERAVVAGFASLLASASLDSTSPYGAPWALLFLLKPNHALGLAVLPLLLGSLARTVGWRGRAASAACLLLLAAVFVLHAVYAVAGLLVFLLLTWRLRPERLRPEALDVGAVLGLNALLVVPAVAVLAWRSHAADLPGRLASLSGHSTLPEAAHFLEPFGRVSVLVALAAFGAWIALRRGDRLGRLLVGQLLAAAGIWMVYPLLSLVGWAEQPDEAYQWLRFQMAVCAGVGAWDLARRVSRGLLQRTPEPALRAAAVAVLALPFSVPFWWAPASMDRYFPGSRQPLPEMLREAGEFLRHNTDPKAVLAGDPYFARWAAALGARRSLSSMGLPQPSDLERRGETERTLVLSNDPDTVRAVSARYGVRLLVVTPLVVSGYGVTPDAVRARGFWRPLARFEGGDGDFVELFELAL